MTTIRRVAAALLLLTMSACATLPAGASDADRLRRGALHTSLGSSFLTLGGAAAVAGGATYLGMRDSSDSGVSSSAGSTGMALAIGGLVAGMVGAYFFDRASDDYTGLTHTSTVTQ